MFTDERIKRLENGNCYKCPDGCSVLRECITKIKEDRELHFRVWRLNESNIILKNTIHRRNMQIKKLKEKLVIAHCCSLCGNKLKYDFTGVAYCSECKDERNY